MVVFFLQRSTDEAALHRWRSELLKAKHGIRGHRAPENFYDEDVVTLQTKKEKVSQGIILNLKKIQCFRPRAPSVLSTVSAAPAVIMKGNGRQEDDEEEEETAFPFPPTAASDGVRYQHHLPPPSPHPARRNASGASLVAMASLNLVQDSPNE